jgi:hypothetical protein
MQSQPFPPNFSKVHFNIILSSTNTCFKRLFISGFSTKIPHTLLISPTHVTFPPYFTLLESNKLIIFGYVWGQEICVKIFVVRPYGKRPFGRPRRRWEDNTKIYLQEAGLGDMD